MAAAWHRIGRAAAAGVKSGLREFHAQRIALKKHARQLLPSSRFNDTKVLQVAPFEPLISWTVSNFQSLTVRGL